MVLNCVEKDVVVRVKKVFKGSCYIIFGCIFNMIEFKLEYGRVNC